MQTKIIDNWTLIHAISGFYIGTIIKSRSLGYSLIIGYEFIEPFLVPRVFDESEGILNIISDTVIGILTYEAGRKLKDKKIGN